MDKPSNPGPDAERVVNELEALKVYFDPVRLRIMQELSGEPRNIHEVAAALGVPFTRLYYQFNLLEKHGFIRVVETRPLSGAVEEKYYQVSARLFTIDRRLLMVGPHEENPGLELVLSKVLDETREDIRRSVEAGAIDLSRRMPHPQAMFVIRGLFEFTPEQLTWFINGLKQLIAEAQNLKSDGAPSYGFAVALYPSVYAQAESPPESDDLPTPG